MSQTTLCPTCGASVAPDQRYCLGCGTRAAAPRLDFVAETERAEAAARNGSSPDDAAAAGHGATSAAEATTTVNAAAPPVASAPAPSRLDRIGGPMGAAAAVLVALGVGFLAGQASSAAPPKQQAPVVTIESALPSGGATSPAIGETTGDAAAAGDAGATGGETGRASAPNETTTTPAAPPPAGEEPTGDDSEAKSNG